MTYTRKARQPGTLARIGAGIVGGVAASIAMNMFGRAMNAVNGREAEGAAPGADRHGRGAQPPQAVGRAEDDAAVRTGSMAYRGLTGEEPDRDTRRRLGVAAHYAFGAATGALYGLAPTRHSAVRAGYGTLYGTLIWAIADEGLLPAMGLSRGPRSLPAAVVLYSLAAHLVYGATLECVTESIAA